MLKDIIGCPWSEHHLLRATLDHYDHDYEPVTNQPLTNPIISLRFTMSHGNVGKLQQLSK